MASDVVMNILNRLQTVRSNSSGWTARCPAHEDRRSSLSINEGEDGRVLVWCFTGCGFKEIVMALNLETRDFFP